MKGKNLKVGLICYYSVSAVVYDLVLDLINGMFAPHTGPNEYGA